MTIGSPPGFCLENVICVNRGSLETKPLLEIEGKTFSIRDKIFLSHSIFINNYVWYIHRSGGELLQHQELILSKLAHHSLLHQSPQWTKLEEWLYPSLEQWQCHPWWSCPTPDRSVFGLSQWSHLYKNYDKVVCFRYIVPLYILISVAPTTTEIVLILTLQIETQSYPSK